MLPNIHHTRFIFKRESNTTAFHTSFSLGIFSKEINSSYKKWEMHVQ